MNSKPNPDIDRRAAIEQAAARLRAGEPVIVPTETVYGVACDARSEDAVRRVFALKGRPETNPLPVLVADAAQAQRLVARWPAAAQRLAEAFWPGPLTIVLPLAAPLARSVTAGRDTIGLRCPDHAIARALADAFDGPLALTSANRSGEAPARTGDEARAFLAGAGAPDVVLLDAGPCEVGQPSTVIAIIGAAEDIEILRSGSISEEDLLDALQ